MPSTTGLYAPTTTPDEMLSRLVVRPRLVAVATPVFTVPTAPAAEVEAPFWWMPAADSSPDPDGSPIFDQLMFEALGGDLAIRTEA